MNIWRDISENEHEYIRHKRLKSISDTRWTAKQTAVNIIFESYGKFNNVIYPNLIIALSKISKMNRLNLIFDQKQLTY